MAITSLLPILQRAATEAQAVIGTFTGGTFAIVGRAGVTYKCIPASTAQRYMLNTVGYDDINGMTLACTIDQFTDALPAPWLTSARVQITQNGQTWSVVSFNADELHYVLSLKPSG